LTSVVAVTLPEAAGRRHVDDDAEVEMAVVEAGDQAVRRFAHHRKDPDHVAGCCRIVA